jgi:hypothetical protein
MAKSRRVAHGDTAERPDPSGTFRSTPGFTVMPNDTGGSACADVAARVEGFDDTAARGTIQTNAANFSTPRPIHLSFL